MALGDGIARNKGRKGFAFQKGYKTALEEMTLNLIRNSRTEVVDGEIRLIVTDNRIKFIATQMKEHLGIIEKTNADRIRSMSDEELTEFLKGIDNGHEIGVGDYFYTEKYKVMMSSKKVLDWLKSEVEE